MFQKRKITAATLAAALAAAPVSFAVAQQSPSADVPATDAPQTMTAPEATAPEAPVFEDAQIEAFAAAVMEITEIRDQYAAELQSVEEETEQQALIEEANAEMRTAIEDTEGLTFDDYMAINRAASMDQELNQRIAQRLQEMQTEDAG
ncbi:DUF4168 domain-containing protein [Roseivivax isoporae]|uniref:DUF4168 domain-containing protein n=1 Tax=Roseivivax isoporae LMG 25204 TaxID=1449351 RepID=X7FAT8_9RHOB|nr:DUF4168 domain-containing protein [Roseivivax isoporae]ETX29905.1 hypothetical protein RISW2_19840 [Roseivivax isoporae LMG 25204]